MAAETVTNEQPIKVLALGCTLCDMRPPGGENIVLAFWDPADYLKTSNPAYFGETIGRVANRISRARIDGLNGRNYHLAANGDGGQTILHGGVRGWGKQRWDGPHDEQRRDGSGTLRPARKYIFLSPDGDEGFPGTVEGRAWWMAWEENGKTHVELEYEVEVLSEQPEGVEQTVVALTNHSYYNVSPSCSSSNPSIEGSILTLPINRFLSVNKNDSIPTGEIATMPADSPVKPNKPFILGREDPILDHCFILNTQPETVSVDTRRQPLQLCATLEHPETSVHLEVLSTEPAFQVYTGDGIDVEAGGVRFGSRSGLAIEPGRYTNATNRSEWRSMVLLKKGEKYGSRIRYVTWIEASTERKS